MSDASPGAVEQRASKQLEASLFKIHRTTDRFFVLLLALEWLAAMIVAAVVSPRSWSGSQHSVHLHVWTAILLGGALCGFPALMAVFQPGRRMTRYAISVAQAGFSSLLIHLTGGRIETHFHVFGSLAFLAFYRDWRVLVPATVLVALDHAFRSVFWPESVFGVVVAAPWRAVEHAGWILFEDVFLIWGCIQGTRELRTTAWTQAELEYAKTSTDDIVEKRTEELRQRTHELEQSLFDVERMSEQMAQNRKLESMGLLAAGIAHEINTPMQFILDNTEYMRDAIQPIFHSLELLSARVQREHPAVPWEERRAEAVRALRESRFEKSLVEIPAAIDETLEGIQRVVTIVRAMKEFSHPGTAEKTATDLNAAIHSTATISKHRWKTAATLELALDSDLPAVPVLPAEINQVLLNLIVNAADAIGEKLGEDSLELGRIWVRSRRDGEWAIVEVEDTGGGIPAEIADKIFDPFFTTKEVGKGTGQGLALCHDIIVNKHQGRISVRSQPRQGTTFSIHLPLEQPQAAEDHGVTADDFADAAT